MGLLSNRAWLPFPRNDLPDGRLATPEEGAEYRRRRRWAGAYQALFTFGYAALLAVGFVFAPNLVLKFCCFIVYLIGVALGSWVGLGTYHCPVCGNQIFVNSRRLRSAASPERLAALYGKYYWCESCGTRFEKYPGALYPPDTDDDEERKDD